MSRVLLIGSIAWLAFSSPATTRADDAQDKAVAFVESLHGKLTRDEKLPGKPVVEVNLASTAVTDAGLKQLAAFKSLSVLDLRNTAITDAGLKEIGKLNSLTQLIVGKTQVTDAGLKELALLKNLNNLGLSHTKVTDAGLKNIKVLTALTKTHLPADITDAGLKEVAKLPNLSTLILDAQSQVTEEGRKEFQAALPKCMVVLTASPAEGPEKENPFVKLVKSKLKDDKKPFAVIVEFKVKQGKEKEFETAFVPFLEATRSEPGCVAIHLNRDAEHPEIYTVYEQFKSITALEDHLKLKHSGELVKMIRPLQDGAAKSTVFTIP